MGNMNYCRFENTYDDLMDCYRHLEDNDLSSSEKIYRDKLFEICGEIVSMDKEDRG